MTTKEQAKAALEEKQEAFRQYLCDTPELEDDPIMDYWRHLSMAINAALEQLTKTPENVSNPRLGNIDERTER